MNPTNWPAVGLHHGISPEVYFAPQGGPLSERIVSKSMLWDFARNPRRWRDSPPKTITDAMRFGSLVDCLALTPDRYQEAYIVQPETYLSKESARKDAPMIEKPWNWNSNTCKAWRNDLPSGIESISTYDFNQACRARNSLLARKEFAEMMEGAQTQVGMRINFDQSIHGFDELVIRSKSLMDIVPDRNGKWGSALCDLKMFAKLNTMDDVEREIYNRGYAMQASIYLDTYNALTGEDRNEFFFVFVLSESPYEVAIVELDEEAILAGREWYLSAVKKWAKVVTTGEWESPWDGIQRASLPKWAARKAGV
jgi:hypothetical protein